MGDTYDLEMTVLFVDPLDKEVTYQVIRIPEKPLASNDVFASRSDPVAQTLYFEQPR